MPQCAVEHRLGGTPHDMLCEICHTNEATCLVCTIVGGAPQFKDLCNECHEAVSPEARDFATALRDSRCQYCGEQPCAGGSDILALATGVQNPKFMCLPCLVEHNKFIRQQMQRNASGLPQPEQLAMLRRINDEADKYMMQWVLNSRSR
jgi:hypothetical protein